jgi:hypothetical protein
LGNVCAELDVLADGPAERFVLGHSGLVERLQVGLDEPLTLLVGDLQVAVHVDDVPEAELIGESWRAAERLSGGQVRCSERLLEPVQAVVAAGMLIQGLAHDLSLPRFGI